MMTWKETAEHRMREIIRLRREVRKANTCIDRKNDLLFGALQYIRESEDVIYIGQKCTDEHIFEILGITEQELAEIYEDREVDIYNGSRRR